jgi:hypothetical protein
VLIAYPRIGIDTAEKRTPHTAGHDMVVERVRQAHEMFAGSGHEATVR